MLRFAAKKDTYLIPLEEEIRYAKTYASIMSTRYQNALSIQFDIAPETNHLQTLKFVLQPILENAIYHGIAPNGGAGSIHVTAMTAAEKLIITVRDNGIGMSPTALEHVRASLVSEQTQDRDRIGLSNIMSRIRLFFGSEYGVSVVSRAGEGTAIALTMPILPNRS